MSGYVFVIDKSALGYCIHPLFFFLFITYTNDRDTRYRQSHSTFGLEYFVRLSYGNNDFIEIAFGVVGLRWSHFEHPAAIFEKQREAKISVLL